MKFMPVIAQIKVGEYYKTAILRETWKLLELREDNVIERVFENRRIYIRKAQG